MDNMSQPATAGKSSSPASSPPRKTVYIAWSLHAPLPPLTEMAMLALFLELRLLAQLRNLERGRNQTGSGIVVEEVRYVIERD
jgi:hypothetical protein